MICENRNPAFWQAVADHPEVASRILLGGPTFDVAATVADQRVMPLAAEHGGFLVFQLDGLGRLFEVHTLFTPEGWGREVLNAAKESLDIMFNGLHAAMLTTYEVEGNWRSAPPRSFGWQAVGDFTPNPYYPQRMRFWFLTLGAWESSPAHRRGLRKCH
jgi:hypothetical protein